MVELALLYVTLGLVLQAWVYVSMDTDIMQYLFQYPQQQCLTVLLVTCMVTCIYLTQERLFKKLVAAQKSRHQINRTQPPKYNLETNYQGYSVSHAAASTRSNVRMRKWKLKTFKCTVEIMIIISLLYCLKSTLHFVYYYGRFHSMIQIVQLGIIPIGSVFYVTSLCVLRVSNAIFKEYSRSQKVFNSSSLGFQHPSECDTRLDHDALSQCNTKPNCV